MPLDLLLVLLLAVLPVLVLMPLQVLLPLIQLPVLRLGLLLALGEGECKAYAAAGLAARLLRITADVGAAMMVPTIMHGTTNNAWYYQPRMVLLIMEYNQLRLRQRP